MLNYQWLIANCPTPNRRVDASRVTVGNTQEWNAIHQHELEQSVGRGKIAPRYLAKNSKMFGIGREKLLNSWVYHIRTLVISPGCYLLNYQYYSVRNKIMK